MVARGRLSMLAGCGRALQPASRISCAHTDCFCLATGLPPSFNPLPMLPPPPPLPPGPLPPPHPLLTGRVGWIVEPHGGMCSPGGGEGGPPIPSSRPLRLR